MKIRNGFVTGLGFGLLIGLIYLATKTLGGLDFAEAVKQALLTGALSGVIIGLYVRSFMKRQDAEFDDVRERLLSEGTLVAEAAANHDYGDESVAGRLFLLEDRLYFKSRTMDIRSHVCTVRREEIKEARLMKLFKLLPNGIEIEKTDGTIQRFVLSAPKNWVEKLS